MVSRAEHQQITVPGAPPLVGSVAPGWHLTADGRQAWADFDLPYGDVTLAAITYTDRFVAHGPQTTRAVIPVARPNEPSPEELFRMNAVSRVTGKPTPRSTTSIVAGAATQSSMATASLSAETSERPPMLRRMAQLLGLATRPTDEVASHT